MTILNSDAVGRPVLRDGWRALTLALSVTLTVAALINIGAVARADSRPVASAPDGPRRAPCGEPRRHDAGARAGRALVGPVRGVAADTADAVVTAIAAIAALLVARTTARLVEASPHGRR